MTESNTFHQAIEAIKNDNPAKAKELLTRLLRSDKENPDYWLWLSSVVESRKEKIYCLQSALSFDATNQTVLRGLKILGIEIDDDEIEPIAMVRRDWKVEIDDSEGALKGFKKFGINAGGRTLIVGVTGLIVVGFMLSAIFSKGRIIFGPRMTVTPLAWTETPSPTLTNTPMVRTPTFTSSVVEPLWMLLEATYTPRPLYVNTPHPRIEAFRIGMREYTDGNYDSMLTFMEQVTSINPGSVDAHYYVGEAHRLLNDYEQALAAYERAITINVNFAPAYMGRAQAHLLEDSDASVEGDLEHAIELDPQFEIAFIALADYWINRDEPQVALDILTEQEELLGENPRYYFLQALALFELNQCENALTQALEVNKRDITMLSNYLLLAQIYFEIDQVEEGLPYLKTYGLYQKDEPVYLSLLGWAYYERGDEYESVIAVLNQALALDDQLAIAYHYRGLVELDAGNGKQAILELIRALNLDSRSFSINLSFGQALWSEERYDEASAQLRASADLAKSDVELGKVYYHVARLASEVGPIARAKEYWTYLSDLPEDAVPENWLLEADLYLNPPTATSIPTKTSLATLTYTPTANPTGTTIPGE
jgi:tetratricopeptide (TPR) repeat protein